MDYTVLISTIIGGLVSITTTYIIQTIPEKRKRRENQEVEKRKIALGGKIIAAELKENLNIAQKINSEIESNVIQAEKMAHRGKDFISYTLVTISWDAYQEYLTAYKCWEKIRDSYAIIKAINEFVDISKADMSKLITSIDNALSDIEKEQL